MKKLKIIVLIFTVAFSFDAWGQKDSVNAPIMVFENENFSFGTIHQGEKIVHDFNFINTGQDSLIISEAKVSSSALIVQYPKQAIAKNKKGIIHVEYDSAGKLGLQFKSVNLISNDKNGNKVPQLKGEVRDY